jgi:nicotinate-nucleotide adenylyltransferase
MPMKIGLMGGTFNPIHLGHLLISEYIRTNFPLDKIIFIPSGNPPHKEYDDIVSSQHRLNMVVLATQENPYFEVSKNEIERQGKSYTVDTLMEFKDIYPNDELYFIIGEDSLYNLRNWKDPEKLFCIINFIVIGRNNLEDKNMLTKISELNVKYGATIHYIDGPIIQISSTDIRNNIKNFQSIKYLVPETVEKYIIDNKLYLPEA